MFKLKEFRYYFLILICLFFVLALVFKSDVIGASANSVNDVYEFSAGTAPWALFLAATVSALYILLLRTPIRDVCTPLPGIIRRYFAFWVDFVLVIMIVAPVAGLLPVIVEWKRTGLFEWSFIRSTIESSDLWIVFGVVIFTFIALPILIAIPVSMNKPTPGSSVMGYRIIKDDGTKITLIDAILRNFLGFIAMSAWFVSPFLLREKKKGKYWVDHVFKTRAIKL
jgi:uncharacterized RDD family membrane protein YckC